MTESRSTESSRRALSLTKAQVVFYVAIVLTGALLTLGITGTHWPHWLLILTNIL